MSSHPPHELSNIFSDSSVSQPTHPVRVPSELFKWEDMEAPTSDAEFNTGRTCNTEQFSLLNNTLTWANSSASSEKSGGPDGGYTFMGICTRQEALRQLDTVIVVLFHERMDGGSRPLRMGIRVNEKRLLLDVLTERLASGVTLWGLSDANKNMQNGFRSKENMMEFYSVYPEAAIVFYLAD